MLLTMLLLQLATVAVAADEPLPHVGALVLPQTIAGSSGDGRVLDELMRWLATQASHIGATPRLPRITRRTPAELTALAFGPRYPAARSALNIHGLYNDETKTIYLAHEVDLSSPSGRAILLHELVHHLQYEYGLDRAIRCVNELEPLAYALEARYLSDRGLRLGASPEHVRRVSHCAPHS